MSAILNNNTSQNGINNHQNGKSAGSSLNGGSPSNKSISSNNGNVPPSQPAPSHINNSTQEANNGSNNDQVVIKHWSQKKHESCMPSHCILKSNFLSKLRGGSDSGQFIYLDSSLVTTNSNLPINTSMGMYIFFFS